MLDRAFLQMVEDLIAGDAPGPAIAQRLVEIVGVEVADAPGADLARAWSCSKPR